ncbi:hypothetical protein BEH94_06510 [Candidatus Altiarchaeales archaeon WOR_SM1_SCG]|nr:hypothetical protein BEH94_06510 [Candidatus Altiarchaeales archaeon WOR_SM1_SCG]ODS36826.1 MAG: hypothetical protein A7315_13920 [Candidatus Altiarchaeales archaeon WOR_SM1_79]ODS37709.1 MAG: hypothetical protein A7316_09135 [Candidatus Altiarchaeales archaeon WOR_SM1_86-2]
MAKLYKTTTQKTPDEFIGDFKQNAKSQGFIVRKVFNMMEEFKSHGVEVDEKCEFHSIMVCNPQKAYKSIRENPIRGAILLPPKQVVVYKDDEGKTNIAYLALGTRIVSELLPEDKKFQKGLPESCEKIIKLIDGVK